MRTIAALYILAVAYYGKTKQITREEKAKGRHHTQKKEMFAGPPTLAGAAEVCVCMRVCVCMCVCVITCAYIHDRDVRGLLPSRGCCVCVRERARVYSFVCIYITHISIHLSVHLSIYLSIYLSLHSSIHPSSIQNIATHQ
jgi:hypothetical protein